MKEAVIVSGVRTAVGKAGRGSLVDARPEYMAATVIAEALRRAEPVEAEDIEDVMMGCAIPEGEQGMNVPGEMSLVSYGNTEPARYFTPSITSIDPHSEEMAELMGTIIESRLHGEKVDLCQYVVQPVLVVRFIDAEDAEVRKKRLHALNGHCRRDCCRIMFLNANLEKVIRRYFCEAGSFHAWHQIAVKNSNWRIAAIRRICFCNVFDRIPPARAIVCFIIGSICAWRPDIYFNFRCSAMEI
jgi:hypothetical protein